MFGIKSKQYKSLESKFDLLENQYGAVLQALNSTTGYEYFDGEKETGELGPAKIIYPDYYIARERAWELNLTNGIAKLIVNKWVSWLVGKGLRFNCTPPKPEYLKTTDRKELIKNIEHRFRNYMLSRYSDYSDMINFHNKAKEATYNSLVAGDILCVLRVQKGWVNVQLIDGANIGDPLKDEPKEGNYILEGVEYDKRNRHVAFWVWDEDKEDAVRVPAVHGPTGLKLAFMIYGSKFRLNETRGVPMLLENFEDISNLERYKSATVKQAEISSEMVLVNEHDNSSTGESIFKNVAQKAAANVSGNKLCVSDLPTPKCFQNNLAKSTKGTVINNTIGAKLKMIKPEAEATMPDFMKANLQLMFAAVEIPYEVAMSVYGSNYSASKAARNDWQHILEVKTLSVANQIYQPVYELWLYNEVLLGRIDYPELLEAYTKRDYVSLAALNGATYTGVNVGDIDPLKTVKAVRSAIGDETTPLMTKEKGSEIVSQQDYSEIQEQVTAENKIAVKPIETEINTTEE